MLHDMCHRFVFGTCLLGSHLMRRAVNQTECCSSEILYGINSATRHNSEVQLQKREVSCSHFIHDDHEALTPWGPYMSIPAATASSRHGICMLQGKEYCIQLFVYEVAPENFRKFFWDPFPQLKCWAHRRQNQQNMYEHEAERMGKM